MKDLDRLLGRHPERSSTRQRRTQSKDPDTARRTTTAELFSTTSSLKLRVATYNIHKCRGLDRRISPARIISILAELDADILCMQEVVNAPGTHLYDQVSEISRTLSSYTAIFGANRPLHGGTYGNLTLSRLPIRSWHNHDLTSHREERGVLQTDIELGPQLLHVFNVHLGTGFNERRRQARLLLGEKILASPSLTASRLVVGDLNEWTRGLTTRLLRDTFQTFSPRHTMRLPATFPGLLPLLTLDHCYYEPPLELLETHLFRTRTALVASDHLPLIADFTLPAPPIASTTPTSS